MRGLSMKGLDEADIIPCRHIQLAQLKPVQAYRDKNHFKQHMHDAGLFRAFLRDIPPGQVYYAKGSTIGVTHEGVFYSVMFDQHLLLGERVGMSLHVVEPMEAEVDDVVRYQLLGNLIDTGQAFECIAVKEKIALYLLNFDCQTPRSPLFTQLMTHMLESLQSNFNMAKSLKCISQSSEYASLYPQGSVYYLKIAGEYTELHLKSRNAIQVRPSTSQKHNDELCMEVTESITLGRGTFGSIFKASTHHLVKGCLERGKHARVVKMVARREYENGSLECESDFQERVFSEQRFLRVFDLKPKPVIMHHSKMFAHLTMREVPGENIESWLSWVRQCGDLINLELACRIALACLKALMNLHAQDVIHGDLKANNLMMHRTSEGEVSVKCVDAGSACYVDQSTLFAANEKYACPESMPSLKGQPGYVPFNSQEADVYALGVVLDEIFSLCLSADEVSKQPVWEVLDGLLHQDPRERYTAKRAHTDLLSFFNAKVVHPELSASGLVEEKRCGFK
jgi:tRNA A-37 threonylcarbamoyl transferase component Bud32